MSDSTTRPKPRRAKPVRSPKPKQATDPVPKRVDPRIAARRIEVKRTEGRRRLRTLVALAAVTLATIGAIGLVNSSWLDVDGFVVVGATNTDPTAAETATLIQLGDPLLDVDLSEAEASLRRLPWVLEASVDKRWSGTIVIEITEREPVIALPTATSYVLVDSTGRQLGAADGSPPGFMPIAGITASGEAGQPAPPETQAVLRLLEQLSPQLEPQVDQVVMDEGTLYLDLRLGGRAKVGDGTSLADKVVSLETILASVDLRCLWEIDVGVPTVPAVTRIDASGNPRATLTNLADCT